MKFRIGFGESGRILEPAESVPPDSVAALPRGSFVAVIVSRLGDSKREVWRATIATASNGQPRVLAAPGTALAAVYRVASRNNLRMGFSADVMAEVAKLSATPAIDDAALTDWTHLPFVTIDYEQSKDLDQAIYIERRDDRGGYVLYYALADAAHYVRPGTALFDEAMARGSSYYLPGVTVPMLPKELSEGIVSLNAQVDRRSVVFRMVLNTDGTVAQTTLTRARIHSLRKLTYDGVQQFHDSPVGHELAEQPFTETLELLADVGAARIALAEARDVIRYDRVGLRLELAAASDVRLTMSPETRNDVQLWNEQISLVTNIEGARFLMSKIDSDTKLAGLFRIHPPPEPEVLDDLARSIDALVDALGIDDTWRWRRHGERDGAGESLGDYVERLPDEGPGVRLACALQRQAMLLGHPSTFALEPGPHYGIGASAYSRFSSPMREIVGVITMHMAMQQLAGTSVADAGLDREMIGRAAESGNAAKSQQKRVTRESNRLAIDELFADESELSIPERPIRLGTVLGVSAHKIYLQLDAPPVEVKLYVPDQEDLLGVTFELANRFVLESSRIEVRVGDPISVRVSSLHRERDRWILEILPGDASPPA